MVIRSHEVKHQGYHIEHDGRCVTIFSAPNYWYVVKDEEHPRYNVVLRTLVLTPVSRSIGAYSDSVGNKGAYINVTPDKEKTYKLDYVQFDAVEHPKTQPYGNRMRAGF